MGRKSACPLGAGTLGIGRIEACFHCHNRRINGTRQLAYSVVNLFLAHRMKVRLMHLEYRAFKTLYAKN